MNCTACGAPLTQDGQPCPSCGANPSFRPEAGVSGESDRVSSSQRAAISSWVQFIENVDIGWGRRGYERLIGQKIGDYEVTGWVGEGGMGVVLSGIHPVIGKKVAIKILKNQFTSNEDSLRRFIDEARAVNEISHPNIVDIFTFGQFDDASLFLVMEYLEGETLTSFLERQKSALPYSTALRIVRDILEALEAAHRKNIVHRDLKPDNIFVIRKSPEPDNIFIKLLDFGVAKFTEDGLRRVSSTTGLPLGTPAYMSPEQCNGFNVDARSDIYSMGIILYQMFTGRVPFDGTFPQIMMAHFMQNPTPPSRLATIPDRLEQVILWCLEKEPSSRPQSVRELKDVLLPILEELAQKQNAPTVLVPPPGPDEFHRGLSATLLRRDSAPKHRSWMAALGAVVLLAAGMAGGAYAYSRWQTGGDWFLFASAPIFAAPPAPAPAQVQAPAQETVLFQIQVEPQGVNASIAVDGVLQKESTVRLPRNEQKPVVIRVEAAGFVPWERSVLPAFSQNIPVLLRPRKNPYSMGPAMNPPGPMPLEIPDVL